uniref:Uncharacterized protein n=1 Tax=Guillardia theta TaxID=55529 RepID=A0A7S4U9N2_GUITH
MWLACLVTAALLPTLILVSPVTTLLCRRLLKRARIDGDVESASVWLSWPATLNVAVKSLTVRNPDGFHHENLAMLGSFFCSIKLFSILRKCVKMEKILIEQPRLWVERKEKRGLNLSVFVSKMKNKEVEEVSEEEENAQADLLLSLLGLVPETAEAFIGNVTQAINASDGIADLAFSTGQNLADKTKNVLELGLDFVKNKATEVHQDISSAGGIDKWAVDGVKKLSSQVRETAQGATEAANNQGIHGVTSYLRTEVSKTATNLTDQAEDAILYELLHRKVAGCYEEEKKTKYVQVTQFEIVGLEIDADLMLDAKQQKVGKLVGASIRLLSEDLVPHPNAAFQKGLPVEEFKRRVLVIINHEMRRENSSKIIKLASSGLKQSVAVPGWMLPKAKQSAMDYIDGFATGLTGMVKDAGSSSAKSSQEKGQNLSSSNTSTSSKEKQETQGEEKGMQKLGPGSREQETGDKAAQDQPAPPVTGEHSTLPDAEASLCADPSQLSNASEEREAEGLGGTAVPGIKADRPQGSSPRPAAHATAQGSSSPSGVVEEPKDEGARGKQAVETAGKKVDAEASQGSAGDQLGSGEVPSQVVKPGGADKAGGPSKAGVSDQAKLTSSNKNTSAGKREKKAGPMQLAELPDTLAKLSESAIEDAGKTIQGALDGFGQALGSLGFKDDRARR